MRKQEIMPLDKSKNVAGRVGSSAREFHLDSKNLGSPERSGKSGSSIS